jgi:hypothetical protein
MPTFSGKLSTNLIQTAIYNMIISQDVIGGSIHANYNLVDKARVDGTLYGDTKLYYDVPTLVSTGWEQDSETARNLLALHRPEPPKVQALTFGVYRQVALTKDDYLSKQAFGTEGAFANYQSILDGRLNKTKEVYDNTTYDAFFGTVTPTVTKEIDLSSITATGEEKNRLRAQTIASDIADLIDDMKDYGYSYTKNGFLRAFGEDEIKVVWNAAYINKITKMDTPTIYHKDGLIGKMGSDKLPSRFFGTVNSAETKGIAAGTVRSLIEQTIGSNHYWPGEAIAATDTAPAGTSYTVDDKVICKIYTKLPPYMSAFNVGTSFFNARNLSTNMYQTWGHNVLEALDSEALVTVKEK